MTYDALVLFAAHAFEIAGVITMFVGTLVATLGYFGDRGYHRLRRRIANSILLGLELLVAADIIATVTIEPDLAAVAALGLIVLIRTFLSFSLEMEATGRWPWQRTESEVQPPEH